MKKTLALFILALSFGANAAVEDWQLKESRYCGVPKRDSRGDIVRSQTVIRAFAKEHPCPSTGKSSSSCPGWQINHVIPLACGGCDSVSNMDWMPKKIKTCKDSWCRDRYERRIYGKDIEGTQKCKSEIVRIE